MRFDSPYASTAADGRDPGIDLNFLNQAQGVIEVGDVTNVTASSVTLRLTVPDAAASCVVAYGLSSDPATWVRTAPVGSSSTTRTTTLTGLQSAKVYSGEIWCTGAPPRSPPSRLL